MVLRPTYSLFIPKVYSHIMILLPSSNTGISLSLCCLVRVDDSLLLGEFHETLNTCGCLCSLDLGHRAGVEDQSAEEIFSGVTWKG